MKLNVINLGVIDYADGLSMQEQLRELRIAELIDDTLLLLQHPPVYTTGRRAEGSDLQMSTEWYQQRGIQIVPVKRGGKVTYHGPGQLVGYLIAQTTDVVATVRSLERAMIELLKEQSLEGRSRCDEGAEYSGAWIENRKVGAVGLHVSRGVTAHGFAINISNDLRPFSWIVPCGLTDPVTSIYQEQGKAEVDDLDTVDLNRIVGSLFYKQAATAVADQLKLRITETTIDRLIPSKV